MHQKFAFTAAAMATALEKTHISYEDLEDIENDFDDAEIEIIRQQVALTAPLYARRQKTVGQIPNFWPLVLEQAPPDIDQYIQPSDSVVLLSSLTSVAVSHFDIDNPTGDPRSISIRFEFSENEYFEDSVLEKKFWYRRAKDGWSGLVSEPVNIEWKKGRDLTEGFLSMVCKAWEKEQGHGAANGLTEEQATLKKKIDNTGMGGMSFFAWFGFIGRRISAEESAEATQAEKKKREQRKANKDSKDAEAEEGKRDIEEESDWNMELEIFPDGDDLAVAFADDIWPGAIKYFTQAQEQDALSDADFESDDEELNEAADNSGSGAESEDDSGGRPAKKQRT